MEMRQHLPLRSRQSAILDELLRQSQMAKSLLASRLDTIRMEVSEMLRNFES